MSHRPISRLAVAALFGVSTLGAGVAFSVASASSASPSATFYACLRHGALSSVSLRLQVCATGYSAVSWNAVGPAALTNYQLAQQDGYTGTLTQWLATLVGPTGPAGPQGATGLQGATGSAGPTGVAGADGKTNYQLAVEDGFTGTVTQWLATLVGPQGPTGAPGAQGPAGAQGNDGAQGPAGPTGAKGDPGATGPQGDTGPAGPQGPTGGLNDVWTIAGSAAIGCFSSCNFSNSLATAKTLPAGTYLLNANLDVTVGNTFTTTNTQGGVTCFVGSPGLNPTFLQGFPPSGFMVEGGSAHVALSTTLTLNAPTAVTVFCPQTFTLYGVTASTSLTATPVTNVH